MRKDKIPEALAVDIASRSTCNVQVGAVIVDNHGHIFSWGWNSSGPDGDGQCAENHAIRRANPRRLAFSTIYVWGAWKHSSNLVDAIPCDDCMARITKMKISEVKFMTKTGEWESMGGWN